MSIVSKLIKIFLPSLFLLSIAAAQVEHPSTGQLELIKTRIRSLIDPVFDVQGIFICNNARLNRTVHGEGHYIFRDPNNLLNKCIIYVFSKPDSSFIGTDIEVNYKAGFGLLKNDTIIWSSSFLLAHYSALRTHIIGVVDLNNDGKFEILVTDQYGRYAEREKLYIISMMANGGTLLNPIDDDGESMIVGGFNTFKLIDRNGKGNEEIEAIDPDRHERVVYSWNGNVYTKLRTNKKQK